MPCARPALPVLPFPTLMGRVLLQLVIIWKNGAWRWRDRNLIATYMLQREAGLTQ
jgi:hypothetical protein